MLERKALLGNNLVYLLYFHFDSSFGCKYTKDFLYKITSTKKKSQNIRNLLKMFLSLHRQNICFGYPGRIPRGARLYRYCPFKKPPSRVVFLFCIFHHKVFDKSSNNVSRFWYGGSHTNMQVSSNIEYPSVKFSSDIVDSFTIAKIQIKSDVTNN